MSVRGVCESCGRDDERLATVQRIYLSPADWDRDEVVEVAPGSERWCEVCRDHYPHHPL
ncbi:MAG: hypothetical protein OEY23_15385 [Acidimicrobiia bacterium]|nr:hypothetical protein [Acidimicrobiia bacterium]